MRCPTCSGIELNISYTKIRELKKGSPSRGKNKQYVEITVKKTRCNECQSTEMEYS
ncbi:hypothetical protein [Salmonella phage PKM.Hi.22.6]|uniref:Uncharacterized protein n=1 Tax=phage PKM.Lu.22.1 TaxID=3049197 RepID=A0AAF0R9J1_9CAUD|nr:hypothetical protein [phage PKM.Lu.22.1]WKV17120.1 hypothetical protein [Salmonella phage PKM.Hi.22.6]